METKTKTADLTVRASFALIEGALVAMAFPLFYFMLPDFTRSYTILMLFVILPIFAFVVSLCSNLFLQYLYCGSASVGMVSLAATWSPLTTLALAVLAYFLPFLRSPVKQLFSESPQGAGAALSSPEEATFVQDIWGYAFYLFWGGVYGQTMASGMIATCPK